MRRHLSEWWLLLACVSLVASSESLAAQARGAVLIGLVLVDDSTFKPIDGAEVALTDANLVARTNASGELRIADIPEGIHTVLVRRVGYKPLLTQLTFGAGATLEREFLLQKQVVSLDSVAVTANRPVSEFEERRKTGIGQFVTRAELEKMANRRMSEIFSRLPGARVERGVGSEVWLARNRGIVTGTLPRPDPLSQARGAKPACYADVWLDGVKVYGGRRDEPLFNLNSLSPNEVETIEFYAGEAEIPVKYTRMGINCGVAVIRTRISK